MSVLALVGAVAVGTATAHHTGGDTVGQSSTCALAQSRQHELQTLAEHQAPTGQIDAVLVEAATGSPIAGGRVVLTGIDACGDRINRHLSTGTAGQVSFRGLQPGRYRLSAHPTATSARAAVTTDVELTTPSRKTVQFTVG